MKLLLIEDEGKLVETLAYVLKKNGFVVDVALDGETGLDMACTGIYDIIVLDRMLPDQDGLTLLKEFRRLGFATPVLMLTAKAAPEERVQGLEAGADDYLVKPFFTLELVARIKALARRATCDLTENVLTVGSLALNPHRNQAIKNGEVIHLTLKEAQILELLIRNCGRVVAKDLIIQKVWGYNDDADYTTVNLYIHYLRKKLGLDNLITVRGIGYCLQEGADIIRKAN